MNFDYRERRYTIISGQRGGTWCDCTELLASSDRGADVVFVHRSFSSRIIIAPSLYHHCLSISYRHHAIITSLSQRHSTIISPSYFAYHRPLAIHHRSTVASPSAGPVVSRRLRCSCAIVAPSLDGHRFGTSLHRQFACISTALRQSSVPRLKVDTFDGFEGKMSKTARIACSEQRCRREPQCPSSVGGVNQSPTR